jgi:hypothetical protein
VKVQLSDASFQRPSLAHTSLAFSPEKLSILTQQKFSALIKFCTLHQSGLALSHHGTQSLHNTQPSTLLGHALLHIDDRWNQGLSNRVCLFLALATLRSTFIHLPHFLNKADKESQLHSRMSSLSSRQSRHLLSADIFLELCVYGRPRNVQAESALMA